MIQPGVNPETFETEHVKVWASNLQDVLRQTTGSSFPSVVLSEAPADLPSAASSDLWMLVAFTGGLRGEMSIRIAAGALFPLAQMFMGQPSSSPPAAPDAEHRDAVLELMRQISGLVASALRAPWGEVQLRIETAPGAPSWPASSTAWIRCGEDPASNLVLELQLSAALAAALRAGKAEVPKPSEVTSPCAESLGDQKGKLGLLMGVELALTLRFGSRRLRLREILDLHPGSVLELDRQIRDPVDVLLDGRLLARGEVVVIEGSYGLRVTEVATGAAS